MKVDRMKLMLKQSQNKDDADNNILLILKGKDRLIYN